MYETEKVSLISDTCHICQEPMTEEEMTCLDNTCFVFVHKECKKNFKGVCPHCYKSIESERRRSCKNYMYFSLMSAVGGVFVTGLICFFVILVQKG